MVSLGKKKEKAEEQVENHELRYLVLHNDDVNTFDYVIASLCEVCQIDEVQAEQCAMITHYKGKCDIRRGPFELLLPMHEALLIRELSVTIE
jgi:ATP-dependent Clp protease adaptor protein ClpS